MGLSVNLDAVLKMFRDQKRIRNENIIDFLESVARQASVLAEIWEVAVKELKNSSFNINDHLELRRKLDLVSNRHSNLPFYYELSFFYHNMSIVLAGDLDQKTHNEIMNHLAQLLLTRDLTKIKYEGVVSKIKQSFLIDDRNRVSDFQDLDKAVEALHREAASLRALVKMCRTSH